MDHPQLIIAYHGALLSYLRQEQSIEAIQWMLAEADWIAHLEELGRTIKVDVFNVHPLLIDQREPSSMHLMLQVLGDIDHLGDDYLFN